MNCFCLIFIFATLMIFSNCGRPMNGSQSQPSADNRIASSTPRQSDLSEDNNPNSVGAPEWRKEAWRRFIASGQYRIPYAGEFNIPDAAKKNEYTKIDLDNAIKRPFNTGDANHDNLFQDLAVIVVDTARGEKPRFGLIIFNEPQDGKTIPDPHWLYRERDLSMTTLSWWSGGLALRSYHEDGTYDLCYVNWDNKQQTYSCDKNYRK